jgi:dTDP-4-amino-4,6-dideoxygalactose transaminase
LLIKATLKKIPFNLPHLTGKEVHYLYEAVHSGQLAGNGDFTKRCHRFLEERYGFGRCLLTTSCTDALEMAALLLDIQPGDEVIMPSYTFPSTANAFVLRGAKIVFADSRADQPNVDEKLLESLITNRTKAIVLVHYAGVACEMGAIMALAERHGIFVVEDAAQAIDATYKGRPLGSIGHLAAFSFHETKNIISGEGGMLAINDERFFERAEILWEKGTNRAAFYRGEVDKYSWVDVGSSFLPTETIAAFLYAQLEQMEEIQAQRLSIWNRYQEGLQPLADQGHFSLPYFPTYSSNNGNMFYLVMPSLERRTALIRYLVDQHNIHAVFHYLPLHSSPFYEAKHDGRALAHCDRYADCLLRLPFYYDLTEEDQQRVIEAIDDFFY